MRVLITGGSGFIGAWIIRRLLARDIRVRVLDLKPDAALALAIAGPEAAGVEWLGGDVSDTEVVRRAASDCDLLIHLAALLTPACAADPLLGARVCLLGHLNVFEAARELGHERVLYVSSAGVFGPDDGAFPRPVTHYGAFKLAGEGCARAYLQDHGIASVGFRPTVVYGPGRESGLTAGPTLACKAAAGGEAYDIPFSGSTDFVFVDDIAAAFEAAMDAPADGARVFNACGEVASVTRVVSLIEALAPGVRIGVSGPPVPMAVEIDDSELRAALPAVARTSLEEGLRRTFEYYAR